VNGASDSAAAGDGVAVDGDTARRGQEGDHVGDFGGLDDPTISTLAARRRSASSSDAPVSAEIAASRSAVRSVRVIPGWTTVTLTPLGPSSSARFLVKAETATLRIEPMIEPAWRAPGR